MTTHDDTRALLDELLPDDAAVERIRLRVAEATAPNGAGPATDRRSRRRRRPSLRLGLALAGAAALALGVALAPDGQRGHTVVPAPATAQAALQEAAGAAGAAPWKPLAAGEYHHTMTTTFTPEVPMTDGDDRRKIDQLMMLGGPRSVEAWTDRAGLGLTLDVTGGNGDPDVYPVVQNDGWGVQPTYGRDFPNIAPVDVEQSLRYADSVRVGRALPRDRAADAIWYRTPRGFVRRTNHTGRAMYERNIADSFGALMQQRHWRAEIDQLDAVNGAPASKRAAAIRTLLDDELEFFGNAGSFGSPGTMGVTARTQAEDRRIIRAIELLGSAPLRPSVRRELFDWLSKRPIARLEGSDQDALGRDGTRVTFERVFNETVPARTVTRKMLYDQAEREYGVSPTGTVRGLGNSIRVPADRQFRRMYVTILFDTDSGELLEYVLYGRLETTAQQPRLQPANGWFPTRGIDRPVKWRLAKAVQRSGVSDAKLYVARERTTSISNVQTSACATTPRMCG